MLTTYIDKTSPNQWTNWSCQNFKFWGDKVNIIYIKSDDINSGKKLIQTGNLSRRNSWVPIKRIDTHINIRNSYISASKFIRLKG